MDDERLDVFFNSVNFMANAAHKDKKAYEAYKRNQEVIEGASIEELEILSILDELGYPLGEIGTYLYKALIVNVLNYLRGVPIRREVLSEEELKEQLSNPFSQLFFDIARNDMDLGIKTFHAAISRASANVDSENVNRKLSEEIFPVILNRWIIKTRAANGSASMRIWQRHLQRALASRRNSLKSTGITRSWSWTARLSTVYGTE